MLLKLELKQYELKLKHTFRISREAYQSQPSLICALHHQGFTGYGEATSNPYYGMKIENMVAEIEEVKTEIENFDFTTPELFYEFLCSKGLREFTKCALDLAAHDLYGKIQGIPLYKLWGYSM